jgi:hypothetical protein
MGMMPLSHKEAGFKGSCGQKKIALNLKEEKPAL